MQKILKGYAVFLLTSIITSTIAMEPNQSNREQWMRPTQPDFIFETPWKTQIVRRVISYINNEPIATALYFIPKKPKDDPILGEITCLFDFSDPFSDPMKFLKTKKLAQSIFLYLQSRGFHQVAMNIFTLQKLATLQLCNPDNCKEIKESAIIILSLKGSNQTYPTQISCIINRTDNQL